jgi:hypothetical protein
VAEAKQRLLAWDSQHVYFSSVFAFSAHRSGGIDASIACHTPLIPGCFSNDASDYR